ncbi:putative signal transducing protein [Wenyingzhuangia sp. IMCC45574]
MSELLTTIKIFDNSPEMHVYKNRLEQEGIDCYPFDEEMVTIDPFLTNAIGGIKLKVNKADVLQAKSIIASIDNQPITDDKDEVLCCPSCGSADLISDFRSMKGTKGILSLIISIVFFVYPIYYKYVYKCKSCNHEFKRKRKKD